MLALDFLPQRYEKVYLLQTFCDRAHVECLLQNPEENLFEATFKGNHARASLISLNAYC